MGDGRRGPSHPALLMCPVDTPRHVKSASPLPRQIFLRCAIIGRAGQPNSYTTLTVVDRNLPARTTPLGG